LPLQKSQTFWGAPEEAYIRFYKWNLTCKLK